MEIQTQVPRKMVPLLERARYKAAYGGRGGTKSHFFAEQIIIRCYSDKTRVACIREVQATIKDSVRQLLIDKIQKLGLGEEFDVLESEIRCKRNGSLIIFKGMQSYNAQNIKSLEDFDIAWVEEAQTLSALSLRLLRPTIRKEGSEIWFSWNPRHETDAVDEFFRGANPPKNAIIVNVNWWDNPWFGDVLTEEKDQDTLNDAEMAEHVWGGGYEIITEGAYFARHIAAAEREGRIGYFPYMPGVPVYTSWDLGVDDYTVVWFFQIHYVDYQPRIRIIDFYEASGLGADEILADALPEYTEDFQDRIAKMVEIDREHAFEYQRHFLPHDIGNREWGSGAKTRLQTLNELGVPLAKINRGVPKDPEERNNATRRLLPICEFHQTTRVMVGVRHLRRYSRKYNELMGTYQGPKKDGNDHAADGFGEFAVNCGIEISRPPPAPEPKPKLGQIRPPPVEEHSTGSRIRI